MELETFLPTVGKQVMKLRQNAELDPDFSRIKADKSIVTKADGISEDLIREWIQERFPDDTICGEERAKKVGGSHTWIVDPIDGTHNFSHRGAMFSISVGLTHNNIPKLGVLFFPAENITVSAIEGGGAFINGKALAVGGGRNLLSEAQVFMVETSLDEAYFSHPRFAKTISQQALLPIKHWAIEGGDASFTYAFLQLITQESIDAMMHLGATPYDVGAICAIAQELGYSVAGYDGGGIDFAKDMIPIVISKNIELHGQILKALAQGS